MDTNACAECGRQARAVRDRLNRDRLKAENAKLRELVEAMTYCMYPPKCLKCPLFSKSDPSIGGVPECKARAKLRELGIEVPK